MTREVTAINKRKGLALCDDGTIGNFEMLLDSEGDVTENMDDAKYALICFPDGKYGTVVLDDFEPTRFN